MLSEAQVRKYLIKRAKAMGRGVRKCAWIGRKNAPDERVLGLAFVELKSEDAGPKFPSNAHERAQAREHVRLRKEGERVEVLWSLAQVDQLLEG